MAKNAIETHENIPSSHGPYADDCNVELIGVYAKTSDVIQRREVTSPSVESCSDSSEDVDMARYVNVYDFIDYISILVLFRDKIRNILTKDVKGLSPKSFK